MGVGRDAVRRQRGSLRHRSHALPPSLADAIGKELDLDGTGRLLDVGCGPGSLTLLLAPLFEAAAGVDADHDMIIEAMRRASKTKAKATNIEWRHLRAEDLPADLGTFRVAAFAQSFHWMDQLLVARRVRDMLSPGGGWVHVHATTHRGAAGDDLLPYPVRHGNTSTTWSPATWDRSAGPVRGRCPPAPVPARRRSCGRPASPVQPGSRSTAG